jgi:hypothetical protein
MGYRSDIYIKVHKNDEDKLVDLLNEHELISAFSKEYEDGDYAGYSASWLKWYTGYKDVDAINSFINEESEHLRALIAIGEDGAIDEEWSPSEMDFYTVTTVEW